MPNQAALNVETSPTFQGAKPIRILYVHNTSDIYGASRALIRLVRTADRNRVTPVVFISVDGPIRPILESYQVEVVIAPFICVIDRSLMNPKGLLTLLFRYPVGVVRMAAEILRRRIAIVHTNTGVIITPGIAALMTGVPHVWHIREWFQEFGSIWPFFSRYILFTSQRVIAVSKTVADQFPANRKILVVHDAFDLGEFECDRTKLRTEFRETHELGEHLIIGSVGRIKYVRKGQEFLIQAAALLKAKGIEARYLIVGTTSPGNEDHLVRLKKLVSDLGLTDEVVFIGELTDVRPAFASMDIFVLPSAQPEPFGLVVLEAMALEVPVVATRYGGPMETVEEGRTGFLIPPADSEALASALATLLTNPELRRAFGKAGHDRLIERFSVRTMWDAYQNLYDELVPHRFSQPVGGVKGDLPR